MNKFEKIFREAKSIKDYMEETPGMDFFNAWWQANDHSRDQLDHLDDHLHNMNKEVKGKYFTFGHTKGGKWYIKVNSAPDYDAGSLVGSHDIPWAIDELADYRKTSTEIQKDVEEFLSAVFSNGVTFEEANEDWKKCYEELEDFFGQMGAKHKKAFDSREKKNKEEFNKMYKQAAASLSEDSEDED